MILANAVDTNTAIAVFDAEWQRVINELEKGDLRSISDQLEKSAFLLSLIPMKRPVHEVPVILVTGEIFVRRDGLSRQYLTERLARKGFAVLCSPVSEWIHYSDYWIREIKEEWRRLTWGEKLRFQIRQIMLNRYEKRISGSLFKSGLVHALPADVPTVIRNASPYISYALGGEAVLTVGSAITEIVSEVAGVIAIGPFGCMPNRISESILTEIMTRSDKLNIRSKNNHIGEVLADIKELPFFAIESDGSPFPQLIEAKLEAFCLRAERLHERMMNTHRH